MILLDSNIVIYSLRPEFLGLRDYIKGKDLCCSIISKIEVLGFHKLSYAEKTAFEKLFAHIQVIPLFQRIATEAVKLR